MSVKGFSRNPNSPALPAAAALLLLAGCATRTGLDLPQIDDWESRQYVLAGLKEWEFSGRVGVVAGDDGFNASLRWVQDGEKFQATLSGPLGVGTVRLEGNNRRVKLTDNEGNTTQLEDAETDLLLRYGWTIPVGSLRYWALGIPDPGLPAETTFGDDGQLAALQQGGWTVRISRYGDGGGQLMPTRLSAAGESTRVKLVIHKWSFFDQHLR